MANKVKNHKGVAKRFKITKSKKLIFSKSCNNHLLTNKGKNRKKFTYGKIVSKADEKSIKILMSH